MKTSGFLAIIRLKDNQKEEYDAELWNSKRCDRRIQKRLCPYGMEEGIVQMGSGQVVSRPLGCECTGFCRYAESIPCKNIQPVDFSQ